MALLGSYVGWKAMGTLPSLMILYVFMYRWREQGADECRGWLASKGLRESEEKVKERGVGLRSERTDVQVVG